MGTGPQKYPGASTAYWYQGKYPGSVMESNVTVWHTTEGMSLPSYGGGASSPNLTAVPDFVNRKLRWYQHHDIDRSSRALVNKSGGVETNTANALQVELVGTCDPGTRDRWNSQGYRGRFIFWPDAPDWALAEVAEFVNWLHAEHNMKMQSTVTWKAYPSSYGNSSVRLSGAQWGAYYGHLGHQHVPENDHGDPGNINFKRVIELAKGAAVNVAISKDDVKSIFKTDGVIDSPYGGDNTHWTAASYLRNTYIWTRQVEDKTTKLAVAVAEIQSKIDHISVGGVDLDALATKVADKLAARLAE